LGGMGVGGVVAASGVGGTFLMFCHLLFMGANINILTTFRVPPLVVFFL